MSPVILIIPFLINVFYAHAQNIIIKKIPKLEAGVKIDSLIQTEIKRSSANVFSLEVENNSINSRNYVTIMDIDVKNSIVMSKNINILNRPNLSYCNIKDHLIFVYGDAKLLASLFTRSGFNKSFKFKYTTGVSFRQIATAKTSFFDEYEFKNGVFVPAVTAYY